MVWINPKLDWEGRAGQPGDAPNDADFNRIEGNIKFLKDLQSITALANTIVFRDALGKAQIEDPESSKDITNKRWVENKLGELSIVEVKAFSDTTTDIVAGGSVEKIITFDKLHKFAIVGIEGYSFFGTLGIITNAYFGFPDPTRIFVSNYSIGKSDDTIKEVKVGGIPKLPAPNTVFQDSQLFGTHIDMHSISFLSKTLKITFENKDPDGQNRLYAKALVIGI